MPTSNYASGDRTPKQKVKLKVTEEKLLKLMLKYNSGKAHAEVCQRALHHLFFCLLNKPFYCNCLGKA
jgi:hypothetical protein